MKVSIIILNYNTADLTLQAIASVIDQPDTEIIVVDNASTDRSVQALKKLGNQITLIQNPKNIGFAAGNNSGISKAKGEFILLLNSDTQVNPGAITALIQFMERHDKVGIVTPKVVLADGGLDWASHRGAPTPINSLAYFAGLEKLWPTTKLFGQYHQGWKDLSKPHQVDVVSMAALLMRREVVATVGLLDEQFFMYAEDIDYCVRAKNKGWQVYYFPGATVIHYKGASGTRSDKKAVRSQTRAYFYQTMKLYFAKHFNHYPKVIFRLVNMGIDIVQFVRH
jgi:GT2 family glycosyltransferase